MPGITKIPLSLILLHHHRAEKIKRNRIEITMDSVGCRVEKMVSGSCGVLSGGGSRCGCAFVANHCGASLNLSGFAWMLLLHFFACECVSFSNSFFFFLSSVSSLCCGGSLARLHVRNVFFMIIFACSQ